MVGSPVAQGVNWRDGGCKPAVVVNGPVADGMPFTTSGGLMASGLDRRRLKA